MKTVAIIGAGASGLAAIKCCVEDGLQPTCFERTAYIGGMWYYTDEVRPGQACSSKTTVANTSKEFTAYSDFLIPDDFPNFLHNTKILAYLRMYATHFDLEKHVRFNTDVKSVKPAPGYESTGRWDIETTALDTDARKTNRFDAVLVCNGHHFEPHRPVIPGQEVFRGRLIHSFEYRDHRGYEDKSVVVVGLGNSGGDAAVDLSRIAQQVYLSTRRGSWIVDRISDHGFPIDLLGIRRVMRFLMLLLPRRMVDRMTEARFNAKFDHASYSLQPEHAFSAQHPTVNDDLPNRIICGSVIIKPDVARLTETGVEFNDGTSVDNVDVVMLATGYLVRFPFLDDSILRVRENVVDLYRRVFPPDLKYPTLAIIGAMQQLGSAFPIVEMQCRWANRIFKDECQLPSKEEMWKTIADRHKASQETYLNTLRHTMEEEWLPYMDELAADVDCKPDIGLMWLRDPSLAWRCFFGPCTPYQFRLRGPGQWPGARQAILTSWQRVLCPLQTRPCASPKPSLLGWTIQLIIGSILITLLVQWILLLY